MSTEMLTLKALSPLVLHRRRASEQFSRTLDYIPGSAVRGALADLYLAGEPQRASEPDFQQLFVSGSVRFSDFLPSTGKISVTRLSPVTAVACKRFDDHHRGSLSDSLLRLELVRDRESELIDDLNQWRSCPECGSLDLDGKRDRIEPGYYTSVAGHERINVRRRMIMGAAIARLTKTAAHSMLFSHEAIEESDVHQDVLFRGTVAVPDPKTRSTLQRLLPLNQSLAVGYGRSRGWGQLEMVSWDSPRAEVTTLAERWEALNEAVRQLWKRFDVELAGQYFSLTLQSHLVLRDPAGQPVLGTIGPADLGLPGPVERCRSVLSAIPVAGWNTALDLPKADTLALSRGSVLLFRIPLDTDRDPVIDRLSEIEREGVGQRQAEGFGRITVCDPFHYYFTLRELTGG